MSCRVGRGTAGEGTVVKNVVDQYVSICNSDADSVMVSTSLMRAEQDGSISRVLVRDVSLYTFASFGPDSVYLVFQDCQYDFT